MVNWNEVFEFITAWYWVPMIFVYAGIIITILGENRDPSKSLAYILVLVFLPGVGLVIYYFFGRKPPFRKKAFKRKRATDHEKMEKHFAHLEEKMDDVLDSLENEIGDLAMPFRYLYVQHQSWITTGNTITLLNNGEEMFPDLFEALENAQEYIHIEFYIVSDDDIGNRLTDILIEKHKAGLEVRVIIDDVGSSEIGNLAKKMWDADIKLVKILPVRFHSLANTNYRDHRKIVVIDGKVGFTGGINLDERYENSGKNKLYWRDTAVRIEGPAVDLLQLQFFLSWVFANDEDDLEIEKYLGKKRVRQNGSAVVSVAASGPSSEIPFVMETILLAISQAKHTIRICTPYFIPTEQLTSALMIACSRGVDVELILPYKSDYFIVQHASFSFLKPLLERGVKVYFYKKGFMHAKVISIDSRLAFVGTVNMDVRSFYLNFEITPIIYERKFCEACEESFENDKKDSELITIEKFMNRPVLHRGLDSVCRLIASLL